MSNTTNNYKVTLAYDGTHYRGWQKTRMGMSIEEELERVLRQLFQEPIALQAASRTDAGVHAKGQVVQFLAKKSWDLKRLRLAANALLPNDIVILDVEQASLSFHPTLDAEGKIYHYACCLGPYQLPFYRHTSWYVPYPIDIGLIQRESQSLKGRHNFASFTNQKKNEEYIDTMRSIERIDVKPIEGRLFFLLQGDAFTYKMARNIVGTLIDIGRGKLTQGTIATLLANKDRKKAGMTAPAHGLTLEKVFYK